MHRVCAASSSKCAQGTRTVLLGTYPDGARTRMCPASCCLARRAALTVLGEQGEDFPFELQPVHLQSRPAKAHRGLENVDDDTQSDDRAKGVPNTVALEVQVLVRRCQSRGAS